MSDKPKTTKKKDYAAGHKRAAIRKTASDTLFKKLRSVPQVEIGKTTLELKADPIGEEKYVGVKLTVPLGGKKKR
tara:strand:- start:566 stop:790 length:225 start_codon:yes stop_codon:yes gene_type:complete